ncbi:MAG: aminotransferase class I/II-fold pyridoxal phosphate-dependent enzyme [Drouetiella hepatica Uher 2000/2452]|jgi:arginine/lysine/ornithine decarboxylase|uniref:Aminotransferase class I/II-fold pyridoxal phosphate-dependent enzyme n=1 Tax=Drouetiella hepatica Uher 2000/2452 TaxID=904376 RepID=A0A951URD9_9CYAN|nr:aminotransferase class I/II-fold pyridoxal phosphate-dependent enzyme [Drouetiella hepatica Uher 2000/2452]
MPLPDRQAAIPLLEALQTAAHATRAAFHTPGHKKGQGIPAPLANFWGAAVFRADLPELPELDNLFAPVSVIQAAQNLAAEAFGADRSWFLANGSTCGIEAAVLATCNPGDKLILPRNVHQSAVAALILSGAIPIWVEPEYDATWNLVHGVSLTSLEIAIAQHPDAKAVLIVSPTYYGVCSNVEAIAQLTHQYGMPLLVDEAHGAHFAFHPHLPTPALQSGADLVVQSTHKTLSALTQAAMLHIKGDRVDGDRLTRCLQLVQSTSPSYLLLASLDAARQQMATQGKALWTETLKLAAIAHTQLSQISGLVVLPVSSSSGFHALDPTRITVDVSGLGLTGFAADEILHQTLNVTCELPGLQHLTFILTPGNTPEDIDRLIQSFKILAVTARPFASFPPHLPHLPIPSHTPLSPRQAFFSPTHTVPLSEAIAHFSAELICPYPPGIPVLFPGEVITVEAIEYLQHVLATGGILTGCADSQLQTLRIVKE